MHAHGCSRLKCGCSQHRAPGRGPGTHPRRERARRRSRCLRENGRARVVAIQRHAGPRRGDVAASPAVIATGPLTSDALAEAIAARLGVTSSRSTTLSRRSCPPIRWTTAAVQGVPLRQVGRRLLERPLTQPEYEAFVAALIAGSVSARPRVRQGTVFRGLSAGREMAQRGRDAALRPDEAGGARRSENGPSPIGPAARQEDRAAQM